MQVLLSTDGRPLDADIELWHGPDNTPSKMRVYVENGQLRPFSAVIETPRGPNTVAIRNIGQIEFPIAANVVADDVDMPSPEAISASMTVQGGALRTYPFDPSVDSVQVLLKTDVLAKQVASITVMAGEREAVATGQGEIGGADGVDLDMQVDPVQHRPGNLALVIGGAFRRPAAGKGRIAQMPAAAGVHGGDQLDPCRKADMSIRPRDIDAPGFQWLTQRIENGALKLRQFVHEQHAEMRETHFARLHLQSAARQRGHAG